MQLPTGNQLVCFGFGQAIMLLNVITGILTTYLSRESVSLPTLQSTALYIALALVYLPIKFFFLKSDKKTGVPIWFYMILGVVDVEGNYFAVKAFNYTSYFTAGLLLNLTVPFATLLCYVFLKTRYQWQHYVGAVVAICGSIVIFATDYDSSVASGVSNELRGDLYCVIAAMFYATSNVMVQSVVKTRDMHANVELLAFMGLFASIVSIVQICALELKPIQDATFNWRVYSYMSGYVVDLFVFYSIVPVFLRWAESLFFNINLLTGPVFTVIASYAFFDQAIKPWYWAALVLFYIGLTMYATTPAPEETLKKADPLEEYHELETPKLAEPAAGDRV